MSGNVGQPTTRADGAAKVTGAARYAADFAPEGLAHAVLVGSPIARGRLLSVDAEAARTLPGVLAVLTPDDLPPLRPVGEDLRSEGSLGESSLPHFTRDVVYAGQHLAVVVAETLEGANEAAGLLKFTFDVEPPVLGMDGEPEVPEKMLGEPEIRRGDVNAARPFVRVEAKYTTPVEHHHPIEPCATVAEWQGNDLVLHDATRWVYGSRGAVADMLGLPRERVRVVSPFVGGAFGSKAFLWAHLAGAALASRAVGRPVRLELSRAQMATANGHRPQTVQRLILGASRDGRLLVARHATLSETSPVSEMTEPCGRLAPELYACEHVEVTHRRVRRNVTSPNPMRAPGEAPGSFALESAMDELAYALKLDPLELRRRNYAHVNPQDGKPYSGKHLGECYRLGAERFGWERRTPDPGSMRDGDVLIGWGTATTAYPAHRGQTSARVRVERDGCVLASCATHEVGTGTSTVMRQLAADALGLEAGQVAFEWGDSHLPFAPVTGASQTTASVGSAVVAAARTAHAELARRAVTDPASPLHGLSPDGLVSRGGRLELASDPSRFESYADLLGRSLLPFVEVVAETQPGEEREKFSFHSFGALFVEVRVDPRLGAVRVSRVVGVYDVGRVLNPRTTRSQLRGGILMGLGTALLEETVYDPGTGLPLNDNLSDYHIPVCADTPQIDVGWLDVPDPHIGGAGARGLGEIGIVGTAAAIANAVHHATGKRVRDLPITVDHWW